MLTWLNLTVDESTYSQKPFVYTNNCMKSENSEYLKEITPEIISSNSDPALVNRLLGIIEELQEEVKKLKRTQGFDVVKGKRQKPLNYIAGKDKI
ncbi:hypothetical protein DLD82_02965 [Methanospirillum stamsii]|uniref:Uncharacterized protein n=2 Tax=Methanospirillum stamsii TaxID=1277351 RepID=A0A2V2N6W7_9EURY|nr:hypothetical protein DLD82_02965 [Methanospirillum stamsii]